MATVHGFSVQDEEGVIAEGGPNSSGVRATGFYGVWATGTNTAVRCDGPVGVSAYGQQWGIVATGNSGAIEAEGVVLGIRATGTGGPAGVFRRQWVAVAQPQIHIEPQPMWVPDSVNMEEAIQIIPTNEVEKLPAFAKAGDLLVTAQPAAENTSDIPPRAEARLWFCTVTGSTADDPAIWRQVLLGPGFEGKTVDKG